MKRDEDYERGAMITFELVRQWRGERPRFAFGPEGIAILADLRDIGQRLARNRGAKLLVERLIEECVKATGNAPTAMMLLVVLEQLGLPIERVPLSELGINVGTA